MGAKQTILMAALTAIVLATGCRVDTEKHGDSKNVKIATPLGGVQVKTNEDAAGIGLPVYPGAQPTKKDKNNNGSANVNLSFGRFQLRVKAASYQTPDTPDKVTAFYRDALKRYGTVIECNHDQPVGTPTQTEEGLTCSDSNRKHVNISDNSSDKTELKTGSKKHQHIVSVETDDSGTKFGLVALDLPGGFSSGSSDSDSDQRQ